MVKKTQTDSYTLVWRGQEFSYLMEELTEEILAAVAEGVAVQTMENIRGRGLMDTRFMENMTYHVTPKESTYETLLPDGKYRSQKTGYMVKRTKAPKQEPKKGESLVANAAPYFIFWEMKYGLMWNAFKEVADEVDTTAKAKYKQKVG